MPSDAPLGGKEGFAAYYIIHHFVFRAQQIGPQSERCKDVSEHRLTDGTKGGSVDIYTPLLTLFADYFAVTQRPKLYPIWIVHFSFV